jgi:hypothetical protein
LKKNAFALEKNRILESGCFSNIVCKSLTAQGLQSFSCEANALKHHLSIQNSNFPRTARILVQLGAQAGTKRAIILADDGEPSA